MGEEMGLKAGESIISTASRYIIASSIVMSIGAASIAYAILSHIVYGSSSPITFTSVTVILMLLIGIAFIVGGSVLIFQSIQWMRYKGEELRERLSNN
ncbi:MAG: hypothetical protein QXO71_07400, partial [Candidatus Jordarchaeaceae archaeon]